jgi:hypothetical protein
MFLCAVNFQWGSKYFVCISDMIQGGFTGVPGIVSISVDSECCGWVPDGPDRFRMSSRF